MIMRRNKMPIEMQVKGQPYASSVKDDSTTQHSAAKSPSLIYIKTGDNGKKIIGLKN